ncbi:MAG: MGMT family protein [Planctomycetota bacterium]|nr:MGMT family protein [Planctomycetota bacterium]
MASSELTVIASHAGPAAVRWHLDGARWVLDEIMLPPWSDGLSSSAQHPSVARLCTDLERPAERLAVAWALAARNPSKVSVFAFELGSVLATAVPPGRVVSYGALAALAGRPGAARAVGGVMGANAWPLLVPCHRVVAADGSLGGFQRGCAGGLERKRALLAAEGVGFGSLGRVEPACLLRPAGLIRADSC